MGHLVVVGASLAGLRAVEAARTAGHEGPVTLVGAERHLPYDRPPLSKQLLRGDAPDDVAPYRSASELTDLGVVLRLGSPATSLDPDARHVVVDDEPLPYDALVVATGASPRQPAGALPRGVVTLRTHDDALALRRALDDGSRAVVVGAGFVGLEVATAIRDRGAEVTVVEAAPRLLGRAVGAEAAALVARLTRSTGVDLRTGVAVTGFDSEAGHVTAVRLSDDSQVACRLVVVGIGADPATGWLEGSGLEVDDGVVCDPTLAAAPGVWAAGDVARVRGPAGSTRLEHWTNAHEQGLVAGANAVASLTGESPREHRSVPYVWSDLHGSRLQLLGTTAGAQRTEVLGDPDGPWLVLHERDGLLTGVLGRDLPGRVMKFRPLLARGAAFEEALELARARPLTPAAAPASRR